MDFLDLEGNGAKGLRIGAVAVVILGWISLIITLILGLTLRHANLLAFLLYGALSLGSMYLLSCALKALATLAEVAQLYYNKHAEASEEM